MTITQVNISSPTSEIVFTDTALGSTLDAVKSSSAFVTQVLIDNSLNGAANYVKLFNLASGSVTVGTTVPDEVIYVPAGQIVQAVMYTGGGIGKTFGTALSVCCVTTGGTAGTTAPSSNVKVSIVYV